MKASRAQIRIMRSLEVIAAELKSLRTDVRRVERKINKTEKENGEAE